ncbi:unnamed protein product [Strongylus vulgaris]|uniref:lysoplasmalogenase n=1 Tax=Strongylus vulgaris TaxID=40348 RepID=A0A3P7HZY2_STRVU|nr:unnamed protein product [Strongylus vulgaris]
MEQDALDSTKNVLYQLNVHIKSSIINCSLADNLFCRKVIPILFLTLFAAIDGGGLSPKNRKLCALGLFFGAIGDVIIGVSKEGLIPGALAFGIGHFFYMSQFLSRPLKIFWPLLYIITAWGSIIGVFVMLPAASEHPIAVSIMVTYSLILSSCLVITGSHYINRKTGDEDKGLYLRFIGYALFYTSDSVLVLADVGFRVPFAEVIILSTYYAAQYLILCGNIHSGLYVKAKHA